MKMIQMKLILLGIALFVSTTMQAQTDYESILTYKHGCHGSCKFSYNDSCATSNDSLIEVINITRNNGICYKNGILLSKQKSDSLNAFLQKNVIEIKRLKTEEENELKAKFIPPKPKCFEFEEFQINTPKESITYTLLNQEMNEHGVILHKTEIEIFKELNRLIK